MKESYLGDDLLQQEALINEFKGNLFEFALAQNIAQNHGVLSEFYQVQDKNLVNKLLDYQKWMMNFRPDLLRGIEKMASQVALQYHDQFFSQTQHKVIPKVMGKLVQEKETIGEADIVFISQDKHYSYLSLKLCKEQAYVNTKSGGIFSFIERYFKQFRTASARQDELKTLVDICFLEMAQNLAALKGEHWDQTQSFESFWSDLEMPSLPGQLSAPYREIVLQSYRPIMVKLRHILFQFYSQDPQLFKRCLLPIVGMSESIGKDQGNSPRESKQLICFHKKGEDSFVLSEAILKDRNDFIDQLSELDFQEQQDQNKASFNIVCPALVLQIRIKPMNKFTTPGHKINCSIRLSKGTSA